MTEPNKNKKSAVFPCTAAFLATVGSLALLYWLKGYAPFGTNSLAYMDANIQYLDFYAYLKEVFAGNDSILYSYGKTLGGSNIAVFSYYLASPFSLLALLFDKSALNDFFDIAVALKLGTAAVTFCCFLHYRFDGRLSALLSAILSLSYAMMQYSIAQSSNIMWLDGVYMLPLILLGVYNVVNGKGQYMLIASTGLAILFNWYSAGIDCIFSAFWFCLEYLLAEIDKRKRPLAELKYFARRGGAYAVSMLWGVLLSAALFFPTVFSLRNGGRGELQLDLLKNTALKGDITNLLEGFTFGAVSSASGVALFCGSFALLGCITFFTSKGVSVKRKIVLAAFLAVTIMTAYWQPFFILFSMFRSADSYWFRYSYIIIFSIIFAASEYYVRLEANRALIRGLFCNALSFSALLFVYVWLKSADNMESAFYTAGSMLLVAALLCLRQSDFHRKSWKKAQTIFACLLLLMSDAEMLYNASELFDVYHVENTQSFVSYTTEEEAQILAIKQTDASNYRISQTTNRGTSGNNITASYNESLAYGYMSITGYTSDPDSLQVAFLERLGYKSYADCITVTNTSIIAADSLLGVKYVLSPYGLNGLEKLKEYPAAAGKKVYYNPYCLPMALVYSGVQTETDNADDPFAYQELLYSELLGGSADIYERLAAEKTVDGGRIQYTLSVPSGNYALYGNLPWKWQTNSLITIGDYKQSYSQWVSPSVFYIPTDGTQTQVEIVIESEDSHLADSLLDEQFYALNLDRLAEITQELLSRSEAHLTLEMQHISCTVEAEAGQSLYLAIPYHEGWRVTRNGEEIEAKQFANCLYSIPLADGTNTIELRFTLPMLQEGAVTSAISCLALAILTLFSTRKRLRKSAETHS